MDQLKIKLIGVRPLIMANPQTVDVVNEFSMEGRRINSKLKSARKKEDESMLVELSAKMKYNDFCASAYFDADSKRFYIPDTVVLACLRDAAKASKKAKDIDRSVILEEPLVYLSDVPKADSLQDAYKNRSFILQGPCRVPPRTGALVWKTRCMMPTGWTCKVTLLYDESEVTHAALLAITETAGLRVGIGGWRPKFGRFDVEEI